MGIGLIVRALIFAVAAMILNVAVAFLWVWFYSFAVEPGHNEAFYQAYAGQAAPISSVVAGIPILLFFGWLAARRAASRWALLAGVMVAIVYIVIDAAILTAAGSTVPWTIVAASFVTKLGSACAGAWIARRAGTPGNI